MREVENRERECGKMEGEKKELKQEIMDRGSEKENRD